jgi:hypothetical protein
MGSTFASSNPTEGDKNLHSPFFGEEAKSPAARKTFSMLKNPSKYERDTS